MLLLASIISASLHRLASPEGLRLALPLLAAHLLGEFVLRARRDAPDPRRRIFWGHIALVAALSYLAVGVWWAWWIPLVTGLTHAGIDRIKESAEGYFDRSHAPFWLDQAGHLLVIAGLAICAPSHLIDHSWWIEWPGAEPAAMAWAFLSGLVLTVWVGAVAVGIWIAPWLEQIHDAAPTDGTETTSPEDASASTAPATPERGLANGGRTIGMWERALIFALVLIGELGAVGFLVAAKSVFRFGELKDRENRMEAEYIIIGTIMSFLWAMVFGWLTQQTLTSLAAHFASWSPARASLR